MGEEDDFVAEENLKLPVLPVMNRKFLIGSFIMKKNGKKEIREDSGSTNNVKGMKKYQTSDFE